LLVRHYTAKCKHKSQSHFPKSFPYDPLLEKLSRWHSRMMHEERKTLKGIVHKSLYSFYFYRGRILSLRKTSLDSGIIIKLKCFCAVYRKVLRQSDEIHYMTCSCSSFHTTVIMKQSFYSHPLWKHENILYKHVGNCIYGLHIHFPECT